MVFFHYSDISRLDTFSILRPNNEPVPIDETHIISPSEEGKYSRTSHNWTDPTSGKYSRKNYIREIRRVDENKSCNTNKEIIREG